MLSNKLKELRAKKDMSQAELAEILGVTQQAVGRWEKNLNMPDLGMLKKIADFFHVTTDELLGRDAKEPVYYQIKLSPKEQEHLKRYRAISDDHKETVDNQLDFFYKKDTDKAEFIKRDSTTSGPGEADAG